CWSEKLGYPCCNYMYNTEVVYTDQDGEWGLENGEWCGILFSFAYDLCINKGGYPCCDYITKVVYTDEDGKWGIEKGNWCGIRS
ncbi:Non-catalytic module family DOC2, partial [Piromyces sp. E2]